MHAIPLNDNHYSLTTAVHVAALFRPFADKVGFNYFQYATVFADGNISLLSNQPVWQQHALCKVKMSVMSCVKKEIISPDSYCFYWQGNLPEGPVAYAREAFNFDHALCYVRRRADSYDLIAFAAPRENTHVKDWYLNHLDELKQFIAQFEHQGQALVQGAFNERILLPKTQQDKNTQILLQAAQKKYYLRPYHPARYITQREYDCLKELHQGKTFKEIGNALQLSARTVEHYLYRLKERLQLQRKSQLLALLREVAQ